MVLTLDLSGPDGNGATLCAHANRLARQLERDGAAITAEMRAGSYAQLLAVFEREFGQYPPPIRSLVGACKSPD